MKKLVKIFAIVFVISVLLLTVCACQPSECTGKHSWNNGSVTKAATCTEVGEKTFVCTECGKTRITTIDKLEHSWNDGVVTKEPTCTEAGEKTFECSVCHTTKTEELAFCAHSLKWVEEVSATCAQNGVAAHFTCTVCNGLFDENKVSVTQQSLVITAAHAYGEKTVVTAATCGKDGSEKQVCSVCGHEEFFVIPKTEQHTVVVDSAVSATCSQTGLTEGSHCSVCQQVIVAQKTIPIAPHTWSSWTTVKSATCTTSGVKQKECSVCGKVETNEIAQLQHNYSSEEIPATCTEGGYTTHTCTRCSDTFTDSETAPLQHNYVQKVTAATCTEGGYTTHTCSRCGDSFTDSETAPLQHNYQTTVKAPTCTEGGYTTHTCSLCGNTFTDTETSALGHTEGTWIVDKAATCSAVGSRHTECTVCHQKLRTEEIAKEAHVFGESQTFKPTCMADGFTFHVCQVCGFVENYDIVPAAHTEVADAAVEPTCTEKGLTAGSHCSFCGKVLAAQEEIPALGHNYETTEVQPTCDTEGYTLHACTRCDSTFTDNVVPALGHSWNDGVVTTEPTCTEAGEKTFECSVCHTVKTETIEKLAHKLVSHEAKAATCTESGWNAYETCENCNYTTYAEIPALGHSEEILPATEPTCTEIGLTQGAKCSVCGTILTAQEELPALGHDYETIEVAPTCTENGYTAQHCLRCDETVNKTEIPALGHSEEILPATEPTCTEIGLTQGAKCSVCGTTLTAQEEIPALGHNLATHQAQAPTCTESGWDEYEECSRCDYTTYNELTATGHIWGSWKVTAKADCTNGGERIRTCTVCGETETQVTLPLGHTHKLLPGKLATCTEDGISDGIICAVCDTVLVEQHVVPSLGHDWYSYAYNNTQHWYVCSRCDATTEALAHDHELYCTVCGWVSELAFFKLEMGETYAYYATLQEAINNAPTDGTQVTIILVKGAQGNGATFVNGTNIKFDLNNCTYALQDQATQNVVRKLRGSANVGFVLEEGSTLTICNGTIQVNQASTDVLVAQYNTLTLQNVTIDASESTQELATALSVRLGTTEILENVMLISKNGVALELMYTKAESEINVKWNDTCPPQVDGQIIYGCNSEVYNDEWVKDVVFVITDENGETSYSVNGAAHITPDNESVSYNSLDELLADKTIVGQVHVHTWDEGVVTTQPTCTTTGVLTYTCKTCDATKTEEIAKNPDTHNLQHHEAKAATCTEIGWEAYDTCSRCDYTTYKEIEALGHNYAEAVEESRIEATCTTDGKYDVVVYCSVCNAELSRETETIEKLGHDLEKHEAKAATCTEIGWDAYDTCSRCDYTTYEEIAALGHDTVNHDAQAATCTAVGWNAYVTCTRCDYTTYVELPALGHDLQHHDAQVATCTAIGWDAYDTCSRCDYTTYEEIAALGHDEVNHNAQAATCTAVGWNAYVTCTRCDYTTYVELPALGHDLQHHDAQAATCTAIGWAEYDTCSRCDYTTYVELPALEHTEVTDEAVAPTCTETGLTEGKHCSVCNTVTVAQETVPALGHDYKEVAATAATCTTTGTKAHFTCGRCPLLFVEKDGQKETTTLDQLVIPATGHTEVTDEAVAPTCTTTGLTEGKHCSVCNTVTVAQEEIPALGHDYETVVTAPTCTEQGYTTHTCSRCDDTYIDTYTDATGHSWSEFTDNGDGTHSRTCAACSATETADHTYSNWTADDEKGGHSRKCEQCSAIENQAHSWNGNLCEICNCEKIVNEWQLVTDASKLKTGDIIVLVSINKSNEYVVAGNISSSIMEDYVVTVTDKVIIPENMPTDAVQLTLGGVERAWTLVNESGQLLGATAVKKLAWGSGTTTWSIAIDAAGNATIQNGTDSYGRFLYNSGSPRFTTYTSNTTATMLLPQIYKYVNICRDHQAGATMGHDDASHWNICDTCGNMFGEKVAHTYTEVAAVLSTCVKAGTAAHFKCEICNTLFVDEDGAKVQTTEEALVLPLADHTFGDWHEGTATCESAGTIGYYQCSVCEKYFDQDGTTELSTIEGTTALGHNYSEEWTSDETGHWHKCTRCDAKSDFAAHTSAYSHDDTQHWQVCSVCSYETAKESHTYDGADCVCGASLRGTQAYPYTVTEALAEAGKLEVGATTATKVYVTAKITSTGTDRTNYRQNVNLVDTADSTIEMLLYKCNFTDAVPAVYVNDTVVVLGYLKNYNGTLEIDGVGSDYATFESRTAGSSEITFTGDNVTVDAPTSGTNGETFTFTVAANIGFEVAKVTVNGIEVTAENGTYTATVAGPTTIVVETKEQGAAEPEAVATLTFPDGNSQKVGDYTTTWSATIGNNTWTIANFNNNNNNWAYIKAGRKTDASTAYISTNIAESVCKVVVKVGALKNASINYFNLVIATDADFTNIVETVTADVASLAVGDLAFAVANPAENLYYKIIIDFNASTNNNTNGQLQIDSVTYFAMPTVQHEHTYSELVPEVAATCLATGTKAHYTCTECNKFFVDVNGVMTEVQESALTILTTPHSYGEWEVNDTVEPYTHTRTCSCGTTETHEFEYSINEDGTHSLICTLRNDAETPCDIQTGNQPHTFVGGQCVCGANESGTTEPVSKTIITFTFGTEDSSATVDEQTLLKAISVEADRSLVSVPNISKLYWSTGKCLKMGSSSVMGQFTLKFTCNVTKIKVKAKSYGSDSNVALCVFVNTVSETSFDLTSDFTEYTHEFAAVTKSITLQSNGKSKKRICIEEIVVTYQAN